MFRSDLHRDHALMGSDCHRRQHPGRSTNPRTTRRVALLQSTDKPRQQGHGADKKDNNNQRLRHAATIHD